MSLDIHISPTKLPIWGLKYSVTYILRLRLQKHSKAWFKQGWEYMSHVTLVNFSQCFPNTIMYSIYSRANRSVPKNVDQFIS
jgi:hypothetical protein